MGWHLGEVRYCGARREPGAGGKAGATMRGRAAVLGIIALVAAATGTGVTSEFAAPPQAPKARAQAAGFAAGVSTALPADATTPATPSFWFHGTQQDQANNTVGPPYTATFDEHAPTGTTAVQQTTTVGSANSE